MAKRAKKLDKELQVSGTGLVGKSEYRMTLFISSLMKSMGLIYAACEDSGISYTTYKKWYDEQPQFKEKVELVNELIKDKVEAVIIDKAINKMDNDMLKHYSNAKMRERGYGKADTTNGTTINVQLHLHPEDEDDDDEKGDYTEFEEVKD